MSSSEPGAAPGDDQEQPAAGTATLPAPQTRAARIPPVTGRQAAIPARAVWPADHVTAARQVVSPDAAAVPEILGENAPAAWAAARILLAAPARQWRR
jgi:hypothetical protein